MAISVSKSNTVSPEQPKISESDRCSTTSFCPPRVSSPSPHIKEPSVSTHAASPSPCPPTKQRSTSSITSKSEKKILLVGDSISGNVNISAIATATDRKITTARAYSAVHDTVANVAKHPARYPASNFTDVIPKEIQKDDFEALLIQAGSVDITNLKTKKDALEHIEYFKQETVISAKNIFSAGVAALQQKPSLKKVVILKQIPRYDRIEDDPMGLKPALSQLFNNTLTECWLDSSVKDKLFVGNHNIDCTGAIREARYRETKSGKFDGIHLFGSSGQKAYTQSVLNILKAAKLTSSEHDFHQSCPQFQYQTRYTRHRYSNNNNTHTAWQGRHRNVHTVPQPVYSVPTHSRFDVLSDLSQGNY